MLEKDIEKILISEEEIQAKAKELGAVLAQDYADSNP
jgi:hypoxanthine phosphoribosyltransferase